MLLLIGLAAHAAHFPVIVQLSNARIEQLAQYVALAWIKVDQSAPSL